MAKELGPMGHMHVSDTCMCLSPLTVWDRASGGGKRRGTALNFHLHCCDGPCKHYGQAYSPRPESMFQLLASTIDLGIDHTHLNREPELNKDTE